MTETPPPSDNRVKRYMVGFWALLVAAIPVLGFFTENFFALQDLKRSNESTQSALAAEKLTADKLRKELAILQAKVNSGFEPDVKAAEQTVRTFTQSQWEPLVPKLVRDLNVPEEEIRDKPYRYSPRTLAAFRPYRSDINNVYVRIASCIKGGACDAENMYDLYCARSKRIISAYYRFSGRMYGNQLDAMKMYQFLVECAHHGQWPGEDKEGWYEEYVQAGGPPLLSSR